MEPSSERAANLAQILFFQRLFVLLTFAFRRDFWSRPCGGWDVLRLAAPIIVSTGSIALMNFADRVFLTWYDPNAMNAAFLSGCLLWGAVSFPFGIATFVNAFVSQYFGAGENRRVGSVVWQGVFLGLICGPIFVAATPLVERFFEAFGHSPEVVRFERDYWFYFALGIAASIANEALAAFFCGRREMKTVMAVGLFAVLLNVVLDYLLIFGVGGYLRWGVSGAAIATTISLWAKFFLFVWLMLKRDREGVYNVRGGFRFDRSGFWGLFKIGSMSSAQTTAENWCFTLFVLLVASLGEGPSAATAIAFNLDFLVFMPIVGIGVAVTTLVGNEIGAGNPKLASRATGASLALAIPFSGVFTLLFLFAPHFFLDFYAAKNPESFAPIRELSANVLRFVAVYLFADSLNVIFASALRGAGDAKFIMKATLAVFPPITALTFVGVRFWGRGVYWCWTLISVYVFVVGTVYAIRFWRGKWRDANLLEIGKPQDVANNSKPEGTIE